MQSFCVVVLWLAGFKLGQKTKIVSRSVKDAYIGCKITLGFKSKLSAFAINVY